MRAPALLRAMRPWQWSKNVFVLAALVFAWSDRTRDSGVDGWNQALVGVLLTFLGFSLAASAIYLLNDIVDVEGDRKHPEKCKRPIASGELSVGAARVASVTLAIAALALGYQAAPAVALMIAAYGAINVAYSLGLKQVVIVDAFCIAGGFLLRVAAGGEAAGIDISRWILLCTLFLALFLALNKRRSELVLLGDGSAAHRANLRDYDIGFLDQMVTVLAACTIVCYSMYTVDAATALKYGEENRLVWSVPFVTFGVARYMYLVQTSAKGGNPTKVFLGGDPWFLTNTLVWVAVVLIAITGVI